MASRVLVRWGAGVAAAGALVLLAPCSTHRVPPVDLYPERQAWAQQIDWSVAKQEATSVLSAYLALDTSNPPGRESLGAAYLASILASEGIEASTHEFAPGRSNLVARLRSEHPEEAPLCLMSHIDVVTAETEHWSQDPFRGTVDDEGYIWGRGALDMKGTGVVELLTLVWLKRLGVPLRRDVVLLAVGDEEVDNLGVRFLADHHWDDIGCSHVLNEGGVGVEGALVDGLTTFAVAFTEKGSFWLRMHVDGPPGHGSTPMPDSAPAKLVQALDRIRARKPKPTFHPEVYTLLGAIGERAGGLTGAVLRSPTLVRSLAVGRLMDNPVSRALITNTINITGFGGAEEPNVIPSRVWAQLDIRMLPGTTSADMMAELHELTDGIDGVSFEVLQDLPAVESPTDDAVYQTLVRRVQLEWPDAAVGPLIMPGTTDSQILRPLGVHAYGLTHFLLTPDELRTMHGHDERIHVDTLATGLRVVLQVVLDLAAHDKPGG
ncbi:MAG: M20/M25/M40 family metallo-hydrolase [Alphaproteobacteria bacterium]|nr:M20/M25/M40 family metallo-hydrolase [Alphaproteobacteria bacterium]